MNHKHKQLKTALLWLVAMAYPVGWIFSEVRWAEVNDPTGRFNCVAEYLAQSRQPSRVTSVQRNGETFYIASGPLDTWLAGPSSPAAYVFDAQGHLIEWSADPGDDLAFQKMWPLPQQEASVDELARLGTE